MKHTPGSWQSDIDLECTFDLDGRTETVIEITNEDHSETVGYATSEANAHLIASAPDLLKACKEAFNYLDKPYASTVGNVEIIELLQQAISKAEGKE